MWTLGYFLYSSFISKEMVYFNFIYIGLEWNSLFITDWIHLNNRLTRLQKLTQKEVYSV